MPQYKVTVTRDTSLIIVAQDAASAEDWAREHIDAGGELGDWSETITAEPYPARVWPDPPGADL